MADVSATAMGAPGRWLLVTIEAMAASAPVRVPERDQYYADVCDRRGERA